MAAPVIFLDVDGVLCTPLSFRLNALLRREMEDQLFDPIAFFCLRRLVRQTGAVLVLSSSWRDALYSDDAVYHAIVDNLYARLARNRTPIADATPLLPYGDKSAEITAWLEGHPGTRYIILDDMDCFEQQPAVRRHWVQIPENGGLRRSGYRAALHKLRGDQNNDTV